MNLFQKIDCRGCRDSSAVKITCCSCSQGPKFGSHLDRAQLPETPAPESVVPSSGESPMPVHCVHVHVRTHLKNKVNL